MHAGIQHSDWTVPLPQSHHYMVDLSPQTQPGSRPGTAVTATTNTQWCSPGSAPQISQAATCTKTQFLKIKNKLCCIVRCSIRGMHFLHLLHAGWTVCVLWATWAKFGAPAGNKQFITQNEEWTSSLYMCICVCILCNTNILAIIREMYKMLVHNRGQGVSVCSTFLQNEWRM